LKKLLSIILITAITLGAYAADSSKSADTLFKEARTMMESDIGQGRTLYEAAALAYLAEADSSCIKRGISRYNAGNAFAMAGDSGRAILAYRRAQRDLPGTRYLADNLTHVRSMSGTSLPLSTHNIIIQKATSWHRWHWGLRLGCVTATYILFWAFLIIKQWGYSPSLRWAFISLPLLFLIFSGSILCSVLDWKKGDEGVIVVRNVVARKGDGYAYQPAFMTPLQVGTEFTKKEQRDNWILIELIDDSTCWVPVTATELL